MATQAQIEANRRNAQKSTGPKTEQGKAVVADNALKHGLTASPSRAARRVVLVSAEDRDAFEHFRQDMLDEYMPVGPMEYIFTERLINLSWRLRRSERMETEILQLQLEQKARNEKFLKSLDLPFDFGFRKKTKAAESADPTPTEPAEPAEPAEPPLDLSLGKVTFDDFTISRVLYRMSLYERRIERGLLTTHQELMRLQKARIQSADEYKKKK